MPKKKKNKLSKTVSKFDLNTIQTVVIPETKNSKSLDLSHLMSSAATALRQSKIKVPIGNPYPLKEGGYAFVMANLRDMRRAQNALMFFFSTRDPEVSMIILSEQLRVMREDKSMGKLEYNRLYATAVKLQLPGGRQAIEDTLCGKTQITAETPPVNEEHYDLFFHILINSYLKKGALELTGTQKAKMAHWLALILLIFPHLSSKQSDYLLACHRRDFKGKQQQRERSKGKSQMILPTWVNITPTKASLSGKLPSSVANITLDIPHHLDNEENNDKLRTIFDRTGIRLLDRIQIYSHNGTVRNMYQFQCHADSSRAKQLMAEYFSNEPKVRIHIGIHTGSNHKRKLRKTSSLKSSKKRREESMEEELRRWDAQIEYPPSKQEPSHSSKSKKQKKSPIPQAYDPYNLYNTF